VLAIVTFQDNVLTINKSLFEVVGQYKYLPGRKRWWRQHRSRRSYIGFWTTTCDQCYWIFYSRRFRLFTI